MTDVTTDTPPAPRRGRLRRALPLVALLTGAAAAAWFFGDALSFETLERNRDALQAWRDANWTLAAATFVALYAVAVAFSVPGAVWFTIGGGFLFGLVGGGLLTVAAATLGATAIFAAARTGLGDSLRARAGGWLARMERQFHDNEISFMLAMRLIPAVPFFVANLAPAFLGVKARTFVWTTFLGIMPGTFVFASIGAGLGEVFDRGERPDLSIIFSWPVLGPLLGLAALSLLPVAVKALRNRRGA